MEKLIDSAKKEVLVEIVKLAQKRGMMGSKGGWKEFLKFYDKKFGASLSDPSRRSVDSLIAFVKTFSQEDDLKFFKKVLQCRSNHNEVEQLKKVPPDNETAEQGLVRLTLGHPEYPVDYSFPSYEEEWLVVKCSKKSKAMEATKMIAIDCEMVLCEDGTEALVKVCAVDRDLQVKLDVLVNPNKAIADYRTEITGISVEDLDGVTHSLKDLQKSIKKLLSHGTILVGHSLSNDLQALKLDYTRVVDTSYIFKYANGVTNKKPSLNWLCKSKLGYELRKPGSPHICVEDARAAMKLVVARLNGAIDDVITEEVKESNLAKLFVHRIPINIPSKDLKIILHGDFTVEVKPSSKVLTCQSPSLLVEKTSLQTSKNVRNTYSAFAVFKNQQAAIEAYENLEGDLEKDSYGRPQKLVKFELESGVAGTLYVCISDQLTKKRLLGEDDGTPGVSKILKTNHNSREFEDSNQCEAHLKEIERLKAEVSQRDKEITSLNKIIAALTRKHGL